MSNAAWMGVALALICFLVYEIGSEVTGWIIARLFPPPDPVFLGEHLVRLHLYGPPEEKP